MSQNQISSIPTIYKGIAMRSRLEARWAIMLDLIGVEWEYEPIDLGGYIPDFVIKSSRMWTDDCGSPWTPRPMILEVGPFMEPAEWRERIDKIARSGWRSSAIVVGAYPLPPMRPYASAQLEYPLGYGHPDVHPGQVAPDAREWYPIGWHESGPAAGMFGYGGFDLSAKWREAGNRAQWMPR